MIRNFRCWKKWISFWKKDKVDDYGNLRESLVKNRNKIHFYKMHNAYYLSENAVKYFSDSIFFV